MGVVGEKEPHSRQGEGSRRRKKKDPRSYTSRIALMYDSISRWMMVWTEGRPSIVLWLTVGLRTSTEGSPRFLFWSTFFRVPMTVP